MDEAQDWVARSRREAAAMLAVPDESIADPYRTPAYEALVELLASAWREGAIAGMDRARTLISEQVPS